MRRSSLLLWSCIALSSASLAPMWYATGALAAGTDLSTEPEDGAQDDFPASSRLVRDLIAARPNEDLVICVAGCRPGTDRVIFAQPADPMAKRTNVAAQPVAVPAASEPVADKKDDSPAPASADATASQSSEPAVESEPAADAAGTKSAEPETHMEPTAAEPEPSHESSDESDTETRSDESPDDPDQAREHRHEAEPDPNPPSSERSE